MYHRYHENLSMYKCNLNTSGREPICFPQSISLSQYTDCSEGRKEWRDGIAQSSFSRA